jgi:hypothetical protein
MKALGLVRPSSSPPMTAAQGHGRVPSQALLDLERGDPDAADLEQIVGAAAKYRITLPSSVNRSPVRHQCPWKVCQLLSRSWK